MVRVVRRDPPDYHHDWNPPNPVPVWIYRVAAVFAGIAIWGTTFAVAWALNKMINR